MKRPLPRVVLVGGGGPMTGAVLADLLAAGRPPAGVVLAGSHAVGAIATFDREGVATPAARAAQAGVPVIRGDDPGTADLHAWIEGLRPDWMLVACYPRRIPASLRNLAGEGCVNLHPSLLPRYRGPVPLFWQRRAGERRTGISLHLLDDGLDTGALVARRRVSWPDGASSEVLDRHAGQAGAALFSDWLARPSTGHAQHGIASRQGFPVADDFRVSRRWSARRLFNFMRASARWRVPYEIEVAGRTLHLAEALEWYPEVLQTAPLEQRAGRLHLRCARGTLVATEAAGG